MTTHYHVTATVNVEPILTFGLRTDATGDDYTYVWLFDNPHIARDTARNTRWGGYRDLTVLAVDTTGLDIVDDPHPGWGDFRDDHAFAYAGNIDADRIEV